MRTQEYPLFATPAVCSVADISPRNLQLMMLSGALVPVVPGGIGRGKSRKYTVLQTVAAAYGAALLRAGRGGPYAHAAVRFVVANYPRWVKDVAAGERLFALDAAGEGRLVEADLAGASRGKRLALAQLDLWTCHQTVMARVERLAVCQAKVERARAQRARGK
jgi:hypothetical protein